MAAYTTGQIVRPKLQYLRRDGTYQDWKGYRSAQGWVEVDEGSVSTTSATFFDRATGATSTTVVTQCYTLWIWDVDTASFIEVPGYDEETLEPASLDGVAITGTFFDPTDADTLCAAICRSRD